MVDVYIQSDQQVLKGCRCSMDSLVTQADPRLSGSPYHLSRPVRTEDGCPTTVQSCCEQRTCPTDLLLRVHLLFRIPRTVHARWDILTSPIPCEQITLSSKWGKHVAGSTTNSGKKTTAASRNKASKTSSHDPRTWSSEEKR